MSEFRDNAPTIRSLGGQIFGASVESDRAHRAYAEQLGLDFPLLSDFNREVIGPYGIAYTEAQPFDGKHGMSKRAVFVIAPDGTVRYKWVTEDPSVPPHVDQVLDALREIRHPSGEVLEEGIEEALEEAEEAE